MQGIPSWLLRQTAPSPNTTSENHPLPPLQPPYHPSFIPQHHPVLRSLHLLHPHTNSWLVHTTGLFVSGILGVPKTLWRVSRLGKAGRRFWVLIGVRVSLLLVVKVESRFGGWTKTTEHHNSLSTLMHYLFVDAWPPSMLGHGSTISNWLSYCSRWMSMKRSFTSSSIST